MKGREKKLVNADLRELVVVSPNLSVSLNYTYQLQLPVDSMRSNPSQLEVFSPVLCFLRK